MRWSWFLTKLIAKKKKKKKKEKNLFFDKPAKCFSAMFLRFQNLNSSGLRVFKPGNKRPETKGYLSQSIQEWTK